MRYLVTVLAVVICASYSARGEDKDVVKKETIQFDGQRLILASEEKTPDESLKEYIPDGENLKAWTKLAAIREYGKLNDPKAVATTLSAIVKKDNPNSQSEMIENHSTGAVVIDFVTWPADMTFVEFNVFKYERKQGGGLIAQQYAVREYKDPESFLKELKPLKQRLLEAMAKDGLQVGK
jgi:hypothetical protein